MSDEFNSVGALVRVLQIIVAAMMFGMVSFAGVALLIAQSVTPNPAQASSLFLVLGLFATGELAAWIVLRQTLAQGLQRALETCPPDERWSRFAGYLRVAHLIPAAMAEGTGLFGIVIYILTGAPAALIAPGLAIVLLALIFPTRDRIEQRITRLER